MRPYIKSRISFNKAPEQVLKFLILQQAKDLQKVHEQLKLAKDFLINKQYLQCPECNNWTDKYCLYKCDGCGTSRCGSCEHISTLDLCFSCKQCFCSNCIKEKHIYCIDQNGIEVPIRIKK